MLLAATSCKVVLVNSQLDGTDFISGYEICFGDRISENFHKLRSITHLNWSG